MQVLWEELEDLNEEQKLFQFLNGLDEFNGPIRTQLLMKPQRPTKDRPYNAIQQEKSQREVLRPVKSKQDGLVMYSKTLLPMCTYCGKKGHIKENCHDLVGYPSWSDRQRKYKGKEREVESTKRREKVRDQIGGRSYRGFRGARGGRMTANVQVKQEDGGSQSQTNNNSLTFTAEQIERIMLPALSKTGEKIQMMKWIVTMQAW
ncbi:5'-3' exoribonuclease 2 [Bienertia sinuspersici]